MDVSTADALLTAAEGADPALTGDDAKDALELLDGRYPEILAAITWFLDHDRETRLPSAWDQVARPRTTIPSPADAQVAVAIHGR